MTRLATLALMLCACGGGMPTHDPAWTGGYVDTWWPEQHKAHVILHQGHARFLSLELTAERLAQAGYTVHGFEMPPPPHNGRPRSDFTQPIVDYLERIGPAYIVGLSGGGWTATMVTAEHEYVIHAWSVAGDAPRDVWAGARDYEQEAVADYREVYAKAGDRLTHIYILNDPCCFDGITGDIGYPYWSDTTTNHHHISAWTLGKIIERLP